MSGKVYELAGAKEKRRNQEVGKRVGDGWGKKE